MSDAQQLHDELTGLERAAAQLKQRIEAERAEVARCKEVLQVLEGGGRKQRRRWRLMLLGMLVLAGVGTWWALRSDAPEAPARRVVSRPLRPHLVVTTVPTGAEVTVARHSGKLLRKGTAPLGVELPHTDQRYVVTARSGGRERRDVVHVDGLRGVHLELDLSAVKAAGATSQPAGAKAAAPASQPAGR